MRTALSFSLRRYIAFLAGKLLFFGATILLNSYYQCVNAGGQRGVYYPGISSKNIHKKGITDVVAQRLSAPA